MKLIIAAAAFAVCVFSVPPVFAASSTTLVWQGDAVIDTATSQCATDLAVGPAAGTVLRSVLRPLNLAQNGDNTTVMFVANQMTMFAMVLDGGAMPNGTAATFGNDASGNIQANVGVKYTQFTQSPSIIAANTTDVTLSGMIRDFLYVKGCTVQFRAAYHPRPD